jgi:hypothetical protein
MKAPLVSDAQSEARIVSYLPSFYIELETSATESFDAVFSPQARSHALLVSSSLESILMNTIEKLKILEINHSMIEHVSGLELVRRVSI